MSSMIGEVQLVGFMRAKKMNDITVIFLTLNKTPRKWAEFQMRQLKDAIQDLPIISVSRLPMNFGTNLLDTKPPCYSNIYRQILRASKIAETKYVAVAEDDVLYSKNHFIRFRPQDDEVAYNRNRWSLFSWGEPVYSLRNRISNCSLIAPRELLIEALTERFALPKLHEGLMGEVGRNDLERKLGITQRKQVEFFSNISIIQLNHPEGTEQRQKEQRKAHAEIRAYDIPHWGKAENIQRYYNE